MFCHYFYKRNIFVSFLFKHLLKFVPSVKYLHPKVPRTLPSSFAPTESHSFSAIFPATFFAEIYNKPFRDPWFAVQAI